MLQMASIKTLKGYGNWRNHVLHGTETTSETCVYFICVHDLSLNRQQIVHVWKPTTNYLTLTLPELWDSVPRAKEVNQSTTVQQTQKHSPVLGGMLENWLPEIGDANVNADDAGLQELLQSHVMIE